MRLSIGPNVIQLMTSPNTLAYSSINGELLWSSKLGLKDFYVEPGDFIMPFLGKSP